jgi:peroxin-1
VLVWERLYRLAICNADWTTDDTEPSTSPTSAVLLANDTEVYVTPRPRGSTSAPAIPSQTTLSNGNGKGKEKDSEAPDPEPSVKLRLVPPRVASQWGQPTLSDEYEKHPTAERVAFCSNRTLERLKQKLKLKSGSPTPTVQLSRVSASSPSLKGTEPEMNGNYTTDREAERLEVCLVNWSDVPLNCIVVGGELVPEWQEWQIVE